MMKTKKSIFKQCVSLGILYILICNMSYSQEYTPFKSNCVWSLNTFKYMTYGDTIINNKTYLKVYRQMETSPFEFDVSRAFIVVNTLSFKLAIFSFLIFTK